MTEKTGWFSRVFARSNKANPSETKQAGLYGSSGFVALHNVLGAGWTSASYEALSRQGFMRNAVVHRCVRMISEAAGSVPWLAYEGEQELENDKLISLIEQPNPFQSRGDFIEALCGHLLLSGNAYVERVSHDDTPFGNIFALRPDYVSCALDEYGWPEAYIYQTGTKKRHINIESVNEPPPLLHLKLFNPLDDVNGFAPLQAGLMALDTHNAAAEWNKALLDNAARPSGALVYAPGDGSNLTPEQYEQLKKELEDGYSGPNNAGKPLLLEGGLDWKAMGLSPKDMDFIEAKNAASRDIALAFGVPPMLLGIPGDNTYANYQEAHRAFFRLTVLPLLQRIKGAMSAWMQQSRSSEFHLELDLDQVESLRPERDALWTRLEAASFLSDDEKRMAIGYSPMGQEAIE